MSGTGGSRTFVVATAGHVDHGKSALVQALTGRDPDRLEEEKRRGLTIDLGFAYFELPAGRVALVDVPGHQRFIRNMLAGVQGVDGALLVVAANEGPMPQTWEHLDILRLLEMRSGLVVITKSDLAEPDWLELVAEETRLAVKGTSLAAAPLVMASSRTGEGIEQLRHELDMLLARLPEHPDRERPRLFVDRCFALTGFGTVVTGTLASGSLAIGDQLVLLPSGRRVRIRGLHQHDQAVERALPGGRTAVNLAGVDRTEVARGDVLARPGVLNVSTRIDVRLQVLEKAPAPLRHRHRLQLAHGTTEVGAEVLLLEAERLQPGATGLAQIRLGRALVTDVGDRFILRLQTPSLTVAGGVILDCAPSRTRPRAHRRLEGLRARNSGDLEALLRLTLREAVHGLVPERLLALSPERAAGEAVVERLLASGSALQLGDVLLARERWAQLRGRVQGILERFHRQHPLRRGIGREELRSQLRLPLTLFSFLMAHLLDGGDVREDREEISLATHVPEVTREQRRALDAVIGKLCLRPCAPPSLAELTQEVGLTPEVLHHLLSEGRAVRLSKDTILLAEAWERALQQVRAHLRKHHRITAAEARQLLEANRRTVIPLLDWLDQQRETVRVGDEHVLADCVGNVRR